MKTKENAVINFAYFAANFSYNFIDECWKGEPNLMQHIKNKFACHAGEDGFVNCGDFLRFFYELDKGNQTQLVSWIDENFQGITE